MWRLVPSLRIDLPQTAGVIAILLAPGVRRRDAWRWVACCSASRSWSRRPSCRWRCYRWRWSAWNRRGGSRSGAVYLGAGLLVAGWWWVAVWLGAGVLFPLNAISVIGAPRRGASLAHRETQRSYSSACSCCRPSLSLPAPGPSSDRRLLIVAAACLLPAAPMRRHRGLDPRNYAGLAVLSAVRSGRRRLVGGSCWPGRASVPSAWSRRHSCAGLLLGMVGGDRRRPARRWPATSAGAADHWRPGFEPTRPPGTGRHDLQVTASAWRSACSAWSRWPTFRRPRAPEGRSRDFLWMGLRDRQLFGYRRAAWTQVLTSLAATFSRAFRARIRSRPTELVRAIRRGSRTRGSIPGRMIHDVGTRHSADVFVVDAAGARADARAVSTSLSSDAALAWLDLAGPVPWGGRASPRPGSCQRSTGSHGVTLAARAPGPPGNVPLRCDPSAARCLRSPSGPRKPAAVDVSSSVVRGCT